MDTATACASRDLTFTTRTLMVGHECDVSVCLGLVFNRVQSVSEQTSTSRDVMALTVCRGVLRLVEAAHFVKRGETCTTRRVDIR